LNNPRLYKLKYWFGDWWIFVFGSGIGIGGTVGFVLGMAI